MRNLTVRFMVKCSVLVGLAFGLSACGGATPQPVVPTLSTSEQQQADAVQPVCDRLDFTGDPKNPTSVTLTCVDGESIVIPGPIPIVQTNAGESNLAPLIYIPSESRKHYVWHAFMLDNGDMRVWHDDTRLIRSELVNNPHTKGKFVSRNFSEPDSKNVYVSWQ